jgi:hypothetical protein
MTQGHRHSRDELATAVAASHSWRGVFRRLGRPQHSAGALRSVRRQVDEFGIDYSHFTGQRRWSDRQLIDAVATSITWREVLTRLGLSDLRGDLRALRTHATRLGIDVSHLGRRSDATVSPAEPDRRHLRTAGPTLAATWFMLRGYEVLWPLEPCRYDLAVRSDDAFQRIQVKTVTHRRKDGSFVAQLSNSRRPGHRDLYDVGEIDSFFVIDAELNAYLIPFQAVAGYGQISLRGYRSYLVGERGNWLQNPAA